MPKYTLDQKLEAFRRLMEDETFKTLNAEYKYHKAKGMEKEAKSCDKIKENYIIETYPELFG